MPTRVLSVRFTEEEYQLLQSLSLISGQPINAIVRESVSEKAVRSIQDDEFLQMAEEAKKRVSDAETALRKRVSVGAGP